MANNANVITALTTDFNVTPYYDDYEKNNQFYRILFKPGYAVQARELTQSQTILQQQVDRFGRHIFKDGSIVIPGAFTIQTHQGKDYGYGVPYAKINDFYANTSSEVDVINIQNYIISGKSNSNLRVQVVGANSGITAQVIDILDGTQSSGNTKTLYLRYTSASSANGQIKTFQAGEIINANVGDTQYRLRLADSNTTPTGFGSRFLIEEGVIFAKGHFIHFPTQSIILSRYNPNPTYRVGFYINENIINASQDASLLDPAQEASNYSAPGADRLKFIPELVTYNIDSAELTENFITLFTIEGGVVKTTYERSQYNILRDEMAKRTYDESGDYIVNGLDVQIREHDDTGINFGRFANGNNKLLFVGVSSGTAYVQGYEIGTTSTTELQIEKGIANTAVREQLSSATMGSYVKVDEYCGSWTFDKGRQIYLYDRPQKRITEKEYSGLLSVAPTAGSTRRTYRVRSVGANNWVTNYNSANSVTGRGGLFVDGKSNSSPVGSSDLPGYGYNLWVIHKSNGNIVFSSNYDTWHDFRNWVTVYSANTGGSQSYLHFPANGNIQISKLNANCPSTLALAQKLDSLDSNHRIVLNTFYNPDPFRLLNGLSNSISNCGGTTTTFGDSAINEYYNFSGLSKDNPAGFGAGDFWSDNCAYVLVGTPHAGPGTGTEIYAGRREINTNYLGTIGLDRNNPANAEIDINFTLELSGGESGTISSIGPVGNQIGVANIATIEYSTGTLGYDAQFNLYLNNIKMYGSNNFTDVRSFYYDSASFADNYADVVLDNDGMAALNDVSTTPLLYYVGSDYVKSVKDADDPTISATSFSFYRTEEISSIQTDGTFSVTVSGSGETFPYGTTNLTDTQKSELILSFNESANVRLRGTVSAVPEQKTIVGNGTAFTYLNVGDKIEIHGLSNTWYVSAIANSRILTVTENLPGSISGNNIYRAYKLGDVIDLRNKGANTGDEMTVSATPSVMSFNLQETFPKTINATLTSRISRSVAKEILKQKKTNRYVKIDCSTAGTSGPFNLGVPDVSKIKSIRLSRGALTQGATDNVTENTSNNRTYRVRSVGANNWVTNYNGANTAAARGGLFVDGQSNSSPIGATAYPQYGYNLWVIHKSNGNIVFSGNYDTYHDFRNWENAYLANTGGSQTYLHFPANGHIQISKLNANCPSTLALAQKLDSLDSNNIIVLNTFYNPDPFRLLNGLSNSISNCGGTTTTFGDSAINEYYNFSGLSKDNPTGFPGAGDYWSDNSAYMLVGVPGAGPGTGTEIFAGTKEINTNYLGTIGLNRSNAANAEIDYQFSVNIAAGVGAVNGVINSGYFPSSNSENTDVTTLFTFDNGQRDTYYEYATIKPQSVSLSRTSRLLVEFDVFEPDFTTRAGYFSIDSYPIEDNDELFDENINIRTEDLPTFKSTTSGKEFNLRNYLDFRPLKTANASVLTASTPATAVINPTVTNEFQNTTNGWRLPKPSSQIMYDYSYYLGRRDLLVVDKDRKFYIIRGLPSNNPLTPDVPPNVMVLASINVTPYPSLSPAYANYLGVPNLAVSSKKLAVIRSTMKDLNALKQRVVNLEYYVSLSTLEKSASDLTIKDTNGLDRFKNGIFTDNFRDHSLGATYNDDYNIVVDPEEKTIRPSYTMESFPYLLTSNNSYTSVNNNIVTLKYTEEVLWNQDWVTTDKNIERRDWTFIGDIKLFPSDDVWIDTAVLPDEILDLGTWVDKNIQNPQVKVTTEWGNWNKYVVGYRVYTGRGDNKQAFNSGSLYQSYDEARKVANAQNAPGTGRGVTIEAVYNNVRTGTEYWTAEKTQTATSGYKITNVQIIPYIRPQTITISCTNLKPRTKVWCFFDNIPMAQYCRPITQAQFTAITDGIESTIPSGPWSAEGSELITDANGTLFFQMRISETQKFRCGDRSVIVIDSFVPVSEASISPIGLSDDITTGGRAVFRASGTSVTKQKSIMSTRHINNFEKEVTDSYSTSEFEEIAAAQGAPARQAGKHCSAYTFLAKAPTDEEGMFLTSVDVFVSRKSAQYGMWFEIRELNSAGQITRNQVPMSEVHFDDPASIPISPDGKTNPLKITFSAPLFLFHNTWYALVIHGNAGNPDTYFWVAKIGQTDINGKGKYVNRRETGTFFQTNNNVSWDEIKDVDLTVKFYTANFNTNVEGVAILGNKPIERLVIESRSQSLNAKLGDVFTSGSKLTLTGISGGTIYKGNVLVGGTSSANAVITDIVGSTYLLSNSGFTTGEALTVRTNNITYGATAVTATISTTNRSRGILTYYWDGPSVNSAINYSYAHLTNSDGTFKANDVIRSLTSPEYYGVVRSVENFRYSAISFEPSYLSFKDTDINFEMKTFSNTGSEGAFTSVVPSETYYFDDEQALFSRTNEISSLSSVRSNQIQVTMKSSKSGVSPLLDISRTHNIYLNNLISSDYSGETGSTGGNLLNRYISRTVTLADGQDAEDMNVYLTAYRPPGTDVKVWIRILNIEDSTLFNNAGWIELEKKNNGDNVFSSFTDRNNFMEYLYGFPSSYMTGGDIGAVQYMNSNGITFTGFKYFSIKIGLVVSGTNTAIVPRAGDLRCIALQM